VSAVNLIITSFGPVLRIRIILMRIRIRIRPLKKTGSESDHALYKILQQDIFALKMAYKTYLLTEKLEQMYLNLFTILLYTKKVNEMPILCPRIRIRRIRHKKFRMWIRPKDADPCGSGSATLLYIRKAGMLCQNNTRDAKS
jgi:hypothetical protein